MWFKNRRAKCRQQLQHQTSSSVNSSKTTGSTSTSGSRHTTSNSNNNASGTNSSSNKNSSSSNSSANNKSNPLKGAQHSGGANNNNGNASNNNNNNNNNTTHTSNGLAIGGHNSSPILPMTPSTSVSPPINVICKKEVSSYHSSSNGAGAENLKTSSPYDAIKESELGIHHTAAYANINARLGQGGGNLTPLGSNSSIMTTPSPPMTPQASHNPLSYVPNHESYTNFWHNQYNNYPNNYNASYYQMDYFQNQSQSNYNMGHSGYSTSNFGLTSGSSLSGAMGAQAFSPNLDYMSPQDKYVNMV